MVENRSQRLATQKNTKRLYQLVEALLPTWNRVMTVIKGGETMQNLSHQIHKIFRAIVKGGHINFYILEEIMPQ